VLLFIQIFEFFISMFLLLNPNALDPQKSFSLHVEVDY